MIQPNQQQRKNINKKGNHDMTCHDKFIDNSKKHLSWEVMGMGVNCIPQSSILLASFLYLLKMEAIGGHGWHGYAWMACHFHPASQAVPVTHQLAFDIGSLGLLPYQAVKYAQCLLNRVDLSNRRCSWFLRDTHKNMIIIMVAKQRYIETCETCGIRHQLLRKQRYSSCRYAGCWKIWVYRSLFDRRMMFTSLHFLLSQ